MTTETEATIGALSLAHLEALVEDLLAFCRPEELAAFLERRAP